MKKNKTILDERILSSQQKINSSTFRILIVLLILSILIKSLILDIPFKLYVFELSICIIALTYACIKNIYSGNFLYNKGVKSEFIVSISLGIAASSIISLINYIKYGGVPKLIFICFIIMFLIFFIITFTLLFVCKKLTKRNADKIFKKYSDN